MWTCPVCKREFRNANQQHTHRLVRKEDVFEKRPQHLEKIFEKIVSIVKPLGDFRQETVASDVIYFKTSSTFLAVKVKADHLEVEFFLDHLESQPPVAKWLQTSAHRFVHVVAVDHPEDVDKRLTDWIKNSYQLILGGKKKKA